MSSVGQVEKRTQARRRPDYQAECDESVAAVFAGPQVRRKEDGEEVGDIPTYIEEVKKALPLGFRPKGDLYVFVDECHRTQSGALHDAMKAILPSAMFIGFTGTPLLKADKKRSIEIFGGYIHT